MTSITIASMTIEEIVTATKQPIQPGEISEYGLSSLSMSGSALFHSQGPIISKSTY